jgi:protein SCO1/2
VSARARLALLVAAAGCLGVLAVGTARTGSSSDPATGFAGALRPPGIPPTSFTLRDESGRPVTASGFRGQVVVLTFLYSTCQDTCPITAQQIRGALDELPHDVPALAVSVDPRGDTPDNARRFLAKEHLTGRMRFLLGSRAELAPLWRTHGIAPQGPGRGPRFDHSAEVILLDRAGRQRIGFPTDQLTPDGLAHDIRRLQAERSGSSAARG